MVPRKKEYALKIHGIVRLLEVKWGKCVESSGELRFECPECSEYTGKNHLWVNSSKMVYHCFKCGYQGSLFSVLRGFRIKYLPKEGNAGETKGSTKEVYPKSWVKLCDMGPGIVKSEIVQYMKSRGIPERRCAEMGVGCVLEGRYSGRVTIPMLENGKVVYWVARSVNGAPPKEISPSREFKLSERSHVVYNIDLIRPGSRVFVVEGIFDAERLISLGVRAVSVLGSSPSDVQIGKILQRRPGSISLFFDGDSAGRKAETRFLGKVRTRTRMQLHVIRCPVGEDPASISERALRVLIG